MLFKIIVGFVLFLLLIFLIEFFRRKTSENDLIEDDKSQDEDELCCGKHENCEKIIFLNSYNKIEYFDDEELDIYKNRSSDSYSEAETEIFREIFYTLLPSDVSDWVRSLQLRGIELPDNLKDEVFLVLNE